MMKNTVLAIFFCRWQ